MLTKDVVFGTDYAYQRSMYSRSYKFLAEGIETVSTKRYSAYSSAKTVAIKRIKGQLTDGEKTSVAIVDARYLRSTWDEHQRKEQEAEQAAADRKRKAMTDRIFDHARAGLHHDTWPLEAWHADCTCGKTFSSIYSADQARAQRRAHWDRAIDKGETVAPAAMGSQLEKVVSLLPEAPEVPVSLDDPNRLDNHQATNSPD